MAKRLRHLLLSTTEDAFQVKAWSGIPFSLRTALADCVEQITVFQPSPPSRTPVATAKRLLHGPVRSPLWISWPTLKKNARELSAAIRKHRPDAVLAISSQTVVALQQPGVPVFMFSDAPYWTFCKTYARWDTAPDRIRAFAEEEAAAARRLDGLCFGSAWACQAARQEYGLSGEAGARVHETPLGANWTPELTGAQVLEQARNRSRQQVDLLFVGRDWERKGGPLAVEVTHKLVQQGTPARLHVVGCRPELGAAAGPEGFVTVHGPLYRDDAAQKQQLADLYLRCHLLLVPTLAECFGIVFAEAQAFALPPVSRNLDALPSVIEDGKTGLLLPPEAGAEPYAERIRALMADWEGYQSMADQARLRFESVLNWKATARAIVHQMEQTLAAQG